MNTRTHFFVILRLMTILCLLSVSLTACGFKLRGAFELPAELQKIYVAGPQHTDLVRDLKELLGYSAEV
ncbi:MAG: lipoprotein B transmembrane, partial [Cycloclasticus pugetii]